MLRPSFPGGVPYPPRPGEAGHPSGGVRYAAVYPPGGQPGQAQPAQYNQRDGQVFVRQPPADSRAAERSAAGARMTLRQAPYPIYPEYRDGVQVLGVGGRGDQVHVVAPPSTLPGMHPHPQLGVGGVSHADVPQSASKRPRMGGDNLAPLRIDTREAVKEPGYHPQVEAISPTPEDRTAERDDVRSTKDDLLQKISKVDREIAKAESQIAKLKKKQHDLEDAANRPTSDSASEEAAVNQSIAQNVYSENRRKAGQSHASLEKFSAKNDLPLYNQPSDTEVYSTNKKNYTVFKKKLVEYFKKSQSEREARDRYLTVTYCKLTSQWTKKVDRVENSRKRKEREGRSREMYEKIFPELRKQREDKERDARLGTRGVVKSDADFEDVIERLQEQEMEDKKMHSYAVIPPLLLPPDERRRKFTNTNGLIQDPMLIYNERKYVNMWTDQERETFKEKYLQHPKNFGLIAQYLERKTVSDCVQYYYLSKKTENYKQLLRKTRTRPRGTRRTQAPTGEVIGPGIQGVVTRRKVEELQGKELSGENNSKGNSRSNTPGPLANNIKTEENGEASGNENGKKKPDRARDSKKTENQNDSSDEEESNQAVKTGPHPCVLCKAVVDSSRAVSKSHSVQLGLKEEELVNDARVCNTCWCKTLKKKHAAICPVPACTSSKGRNRGKLRHLPSKWAELDSKSKETIVAELQLPDNTKRVCTACFTRITRRISQLEGVSGEVKKEKEEPVNWSEAEIECARESLRNHGTNWGRMAEAVKVKTEEQCKKFFYNQRKRLQLDKVVTEYKRATRPEGSDKPSLTSDEESGSTTSSCEEDPALTIDTDAQAAPKQDADLKPPAVPPVSESKPEPENIKKVEEGYDSSATMSADETGEPVGAPPKARQVGAPVPVGVANTCRANNMPMTVNDLMETVISHTLQTPGTSVSAVSVAPVVVTTAPPRTDIPSLNNILQEAGPSPHYRNYVKEALPVPRNMTGKETPPGTSPGLPPISRPDLEVRPVGPVPAQASLPQQPTTDVLDLTVSRPDRSSPAPAAPGPPDHPSYPGFSKLVEPRPETFGKEPPAAHGGPKAKTTHMEMMMQDPTFPHLFRKENKSPAPYTSDRTSVHSPGPQLVHRGDPRKDLNPKSQPPPLHPNKSLASHPSGLQITPSRGGSLVHGTPKAQPGHPGGPGPPLQHSPRTYDGQNPRGPGIQSGIPVYNNKQGHRGHPTRPSDTGRSSHPAMDVYKQSSPAYPPYQSPRPASHEPPPSGAPPLSSSSRRIIEDAYTIAQSLPRKDPRDQGSSGFPRTIDPHRRDPGDPRNDPARFGQDSRSGIYGTGGAQRFPFGGRGDPRAEVRGDPRADIPSRDPNARGDPRDIYRPDPRLPVDPRDPRPDPRAAPLMDPRGRPPYPGYDPRMPHHQPGRRSPSRTMPSNMANSHHPVIPPQPSARGSITAGKPRDVDIYHSPRHPEVSITKQPSAGSREYQNSSLSDLAEVAASQQRITDGRVDHRQIPASRAEAASSRGPVAMSMMDPRVYDPRARADMEKRSAELGPPRVPSRDSQRSEQDDRERQHRAMMMKLNQMSESEKQQYLSAISGGLTRNSEQMTASHLIDLIITHQINKNTVGGGPQNPRRSPQAVGDGKDSPSKAPSRSPSVKSMTERDGMDGASGSAIRTSPGTMGEHIENMINKEVNRNSTTSPYPGPSNSSENHEHWKRRGYPPDQAGYSQTRPPSQPRPPSNSHPQLSTDERQILRVAQNASPRPDKPPSRSSMHEAISPPTSEPGRGHPSHQGYYPPQQDQAMARFLAARRKQEADAAAAAAAKSGFGVSHFMDDYVKHKITEVMKNEKSGGAGPSDLSSKPSSHGGPMGPPHKRPLEVEARGSPSEHPSGTPESPRKRYKQDEAGGSNDMPDSPESGDMVIDESARPDSAHSHKTNSPAPNADPSHYPPSYRGGVPPPRSSPAPGQSRPPPQNPVALARYEPLSDDD